MVNEIVLEEIERTTTRLNRELGLTVILVEQRLEFARSIASKFVILEKGSVVATGTSRELTL